MYLLMTKKFSKWAKKKKINAQILAKSLHEVTIGRFEASLGTHIYKKRIARSGVGKSGGHRTIICLKQNDRAVYMHGFSKSAKENVSDKELLALKEYAGILLNMSDDELQTAITTGALVEVNNG